jgi:hypothetical protein
VAPGDVDVREEGFAPVEPDSAETTPLAVLPDLGGVEAGGAEVRDGLDDAADQRRLAAAGRAGEEELRRVRMRPASSVPSGAPPPIVAALGPAALPTTPA